MIKITEPKVSLIEKQNALAVNDRVLRAGLLAKKAEIPRNVRITDAQQKEEDWIEHEVPKGLISYSAQYSDDTEVFR